MEVKYFSALASGVVWRSVEGIWKRRLAVILWIVLVVSGLAMAVGSVVLVREVWGDAPVVGGIVGGLLGGVLSVAIRRAFRSREERRATVAR